ncbi:MAG: hypothetical protein WCF70_08325, partial [Dehalococcoidales bacterium]
RNTGEPWIGSLMIRISEFCLVAAAWNMGLNGGFGPDRHNGFILLCINGPGTVAGKALSSAGWIKCNYKPSFSMDFLSASAFFQISAFSSSTT